MSSHPRPSRRALLAALGASGLAACAAPSPQLALQDGEGAPRAPDPTEPRGGIGGTGITVGVIGTLTGFGSLKVNGVTLRTEAREAASALGPLPLAPGHVLEAGAARVAGGLELRSLRAVIALAGPVTRAPTPDGVLAIGGVEVRMEPGAALPPGGAPLGARLAASGLWSPDGGVLIASRLDPAPEGAPDLIAGDLADVSTGVTDVARLGGARVSAAGGALVSGSYHVLLGRFAAEREFAAEAVEVGRPLFGARLEAFSAEGYLGRGDRRGVFVRGLGAPIDPGPRIDRLASGRAVFIGSFDGVFRVAHGIPLPEGAGPRAFALQRVGDGLAPRTGAVDTR